MNTLPTIHMNGTSAKMLMEGYDALSFALLEAAQAFGKCEFNGRDYYPQGPEAWTAARDEWEKMQADIHAVREKVNALLVHIHEQSQPRRPKFAVTSCSQCGRDFGPDNNGFSHCRNHQCGVCRYSSEVEGRIDHVHCNCAGSINYGGDVEAAGTCACFERRGEQ